MGCMSEDFLCLEQQLCGLSFGCPIVGGDGPRSVGCRAVGDAIAEALHIRM